MRCPRSLVLALFLSLAVLNRDSALAVDQLKDLQAAAVAEGKAVWGYWGTNPEKYSTWTTHSNRLIPVYTFGASLDSVRGVNSAYRSEAGLQKLYGRVPRDTLNPQADYFDQTDIARLQRDALAAGKKYVVLIVFDGMDWQTTQAAALYKTGKVSYREGRGTGLQFQDYRGAPTDFGFFVTSPSSEASGIDVDAQTVINDDNVSLGGYNPQHGGATPWTPGDDPTYLIGKCQECRHAVTDSAASATSLCAGIKTYNVAINIDAAGKQVAPVSHEFQATGRSIGVVTSVPISHATPACAYANNVSRDDFQDLTRDLLGLPSVSHRAHPLLGVDVLLGAGWGEQSAEDRKQGANFVPGNKYLAADDLQRSDEAHGGKYVVAQRTSGESGRAGLEKAAATAAAQGKRLFGFYGAKSGHLPFATADGLYDPTSGVKGLSEVYSEADVNENPSLADMSRAALTVLEQNPRGFWLMIEAGDVDWANHDNNIDNSVGAVLSGDAAFRAVVDWVEARQAWDDTVVILTADHGHYFQLREPATISSASAAGR